MKKWPYPPKRPILVKKLNKEGHFRCRKWVLGFAMKNETNVINELWGVWAPCFCTFYSLGCFAPLAFGSGNHSWIDHFKGGGQPPPFQRNQMLLGISFRSFSFLSQNWETQKSIVWGSWVPRFRWFSSLDRILTLGFGSEITLKLTFLKGAAPLYFRVIQLTSKCLRI